MGVWDWEWDLGSYEIKCLGFRLNFWALMIYKIKDVWNCLLGLIICFIIFEFHFLITIYFLTSLSSSSKKKPSAFFRLGEKKKLACAFEGCLTRPIRRRRIGGQGLSFFFSGWQFIDYYIFLFWSVIFDECFADAFSCVVVAALGKEWK